MFDPPFDASGLGLSRSLRISVVRRTSVRQVFFELWTKSANRKRLKCHLSNFLQIVLKTSITLHHLQPKWNSAAQNKEERMYFAQSMENQRIWAHVDCTSDH